MTGYQKVLIAVDFSEATEAVCQRGVAVAAAFGAPIVLLHVVEPIVFDPGQDLLPALPVDFEEQRRRAAEKEIQRLGDSLHLRPEQCRVGVGATRPEIVRHAEELGADLVVLGSHGRSGVARLLGSSANAVLHHAPCDVLAVRVGQ